MNGLLNCGVEVWKFDLSYQASLNAMTFSINSSSNFLVICAYRGSVQLNERACAQEYFSRSAIIIQITLSVPFH